ncbi:competence/damage-inducible protein A [Maritimibacter dapengensis]|uniref:Competence/damage-inducible protein A n=1 Tax=Maritimibacter dapengensis TaxID=2836868 RepID=A0ABS6T603_9RHOB|nr:molybdopterin-binding protein [Maritimibacter dapengensis]MBV7380385.1 competence/damage-inducible protein A [Maritimibacter dapengensis]
MTNPTAAMIVIGDEILSGRTRDSNMNHLAKELTQHGVELCEARVVSDDRAAIVQAVRDLSGCYDHIFTSGGIGPTHDDITADSVAEAFGDHIDIRDDARKLLMDYFESRGVEATEGRMRMARIPDSATLIDNPVSIAPGFTIRNVHVMAGVPAVFEAMVASVLPGIKGGAPLLSQTLRIDRPEGEVAGPLRKLAETYPDVSIGSYPFNDKGAFGTNIVIRGQDGASVDAAMIALCEEFPNP